MGLAALGALVGCGAPTEPEQSKSAFPPHDSRLVDLSHVVRTDIPYLPREPMTRFTRDGSGAARAVTLGLRNGTSLRIIDPHASAEQTLEHLSPRDLILPICCIDLRDSVQEQGAFRLDGSSIEYWEQSHQPIPAGAAVLFVTGWDMRWGDAKAYLNLDAHENPVTPGLSDEAYGLLHQRQVRAIGFDTLTVRPVPATQPWLLIDNMTNLEQLPPTGATLFLGPLKLQATSAGPVRAIGLVTSTS
jgi:kynurenine formamidase